MTGKVKCDVHSSASEITYISSLLRCAFQQIQKQEAKTLACRNISQYVNQKNKKHKVSIIFYKMKMLPVAFGYQESQYEMVLVFQLA